MLLGLGCFVLEEYVAGCIILVGTIGINPLFHKVKVKKEKLFHHLRRIISFVLIVIGISVTSVNHGRLKIVDYYLENSHEEIISILNERLTEHGEKIENFNEVETNNIGVENDYKIYETKLKDNLNIQLVEKNERVEAIRTCAIIEDDYNVSDENTTNTAGLIMGIIMNECGVGVEEGNLIAEELEKNNYNGNVTRDNFIVTMQTTDFYIEMVMIYNTSKSKLIAEINTSEVTQKVTELKENSEVEKMESNLKNIKQKVENEETNIYTLKEIKDTLETYKKDIESLNLQKEENIAKKENWKNTISELIEKINTKINVVVPDFNTMSSSEAENWGKNNNMTVTTSTDYSDTILNGKVISQSINAGQTIEKGSNTIKVVYSIGRKPTMGELNALKKAQSYSDNMHMSKKRLYEQLTSSYGEGFTDSEAQYAIDHVQADWNYNALQKAKSYQSSMNMSKNRIYQQLTSSYGENFTASEAQYAIDHLED